MNYKTLWKRLSKQREREREAIHRFLLWLLASDLTPQQREAIAAKMRELLNF